MDYYDDIDIIGNIVGVSPTDSTFTIMSTGALVVPVGTSAEYPALPADGMIRYNTDHGLFEFHQSGTWGNVAAGGNINLIGDVVGNGTVDSNITTTLATVNSNIGTFGSNVAIPVVTVNGKGLVTAVSTVEVSQFIRQEVEANVVFTVPAGYGYTAVGPYVNNGDMIINGDMVIL